MSHKRRATIGVALVVGLLLVGCGASSADNTDDVPPLLQTISVADGLLSLQTPAGWIVDDGAFATDALLRLQSDPAREDGVPVGQVVWVALATPDPDVDLRAVIASATQLSDTSQIKTETRNQRPVARLTLQMFEEVGEEWYPVSIEVFATVIDGVQVTITCLNYEQPSPVLFAAIFDSLSIDGSQWPPD